MKKITYQDVYSGKYSDYMFRWHGWYIMGRDLQDIIEWSLTGLDQDKRQICLDRTIDNL